MVLSGMSDLEQARDNIATFSACEPLSPAEGDALDRALELLKTQLFVPCTQCRYCDGCPQGLDIPQLLGLYNNYRLSGGRMAYDQLSQASRPDRCISCGQCAAKCPQHIDIPAVMAPVCPSHGRLRDYFPSRIIPWRQLSASDRLPNWSMRPMRTASSP